MSTPYHAKYFAHEISRHRTGGTVQQLTHSLFDACVDLNPHQIEAALFAIQSPLSKGAILADEVGLGKTIEAGLLLCQYWAERKRKLVIICPAALRKQWSNELHEKFHLPNKVLDSKILNNLTQGGTRNPFAEECVYIMSIHFAARISVKMRTVDWDLAVVDEAHKLRNVFRKKNKLAQEIKWALEERKKILLTATPLQNSLMELYGLSTLIDEHFFGDAEAFRQQFVNRKDDFTELRFRLGQFIHRTLREDVMEFIRYTERKSMTLTYKTTDAEQRLYDAISEFISREETYSVPKNQRHLMTLVLRKILASSRYAMTQTLRTMQARLIALRDGEQEKLPLLETFIRMDEVEDEYLEDFYNELNADAAEETIDIELLNAEIAELGGLINMAEKIQEDTKSETLLSALEIGFKELLKMQAKQKAIIFTESRRTQEYLAGYLAKNGYGGKIVLFNGSNTDAVSKEIYDDWLQRNKNSGRISGSRVIDMRAAIVEFFRDQGEIMIATEAAAEGVNLQFCSLLINYDLPWNPQRIEQRIGRCHRYGQKHDVVVINFLNERNATDARVYELLDNKFALFNGVFGASDEILGTIEDGVDFERRIHNIYQDCRDPEEIESAFCKLQKELEEHIDARMNETKDKLLKHFDRDVHKRLKVNLQETRDYLDHIGQMFWELSKYKLAEVADFDKRNLEFTLHKSPLPDVHAGRYKLVSKLHPNTTGDFLYRLAHPLGEFVIETGKNVQTRCAQVYFDYSGHQEKISQLSKLRGQSGWMILSKLTIKSFEPEEYLIFNGLTDRNRILDQETCENFFHLRGAMSKSTEFPENKNARLKELLDKSINNHFNRSVELNYAHFVDECERLDKWADDTVDHVEKDIDRIKKEIRSLGMQARLTKDAVEQHKLQTEIKKCEREKRRLRERLFQVEDDITEKRDGIIDRLAARMKNEREIETLFMIRWTLI